jgi:hypothetical protein
MKQIQIIALIEAMDRLREKATKKETRKASETPSKEPESGHLYHATHDRNAMDIARGGLVTHHPSHGTDQRAWPDGATHRRSYFSHSPDIAKSFHPEGGKPVMLRVHPSRAKFKREVGTGDWYTRHKIHQKHIEIQGPDGAWNPITKHYKEP